MNYRILKIVAIIAIILSIIIAISLGVKIFFNGAYLVTQETFTPEQESYLKELCIKQDSSSAQVVYYERRLNFLYEIMCEDPPYCGDIVCKLKLERPFYDQINKNDFSVAFSAHNEELNSEYAIVSFTRRLYVPPKEILKGIESKGQKQLVFTGIETRSKRIDAMPIVRIVSSVSLVLLITSIFILIIGRKKNYEKI